MEYTQEISSKETLDEIMSDDGPTVMIDFWAGWCVPCRMMAPHFEAVAQAMADKPVVFYKLDTEAYPEFAQAFNVRSLPTIVMIHRGKVFDALMGAKDAATVQKKAEWLLSKARGESFFKRLFR